MFYAFMRLKMKKKKPNVFDARDIYRRAQIILKSTLFKLMFVVFEENGEGGLLIYEKGILWF